VKPEVGDTVQSKQRMLQLSLEQEYEQADYRETSPFEHPTRYGQIEVPGPEGGGVEANNQQSQVKGARLLGPEQYQVKRYAQYDKVDDILPPEQIY